MKDLKEFGIYHGEGRFHEEIIYSTALIYHIVSSRIEKYLKTYDLNIGKFNILMAIKNNNKEEGISQVEISKHLIVTPSNMTKMIDKLEKEKLVLRSAAKEDRRINMISITERGLSVLGEVWYGYDKCLKDEVKCLNKKEQKLLSDLLIKWFKAI